MTTFSVFVCMILVISCSFGYHFSCNSVLQGALFPHQISCRTAQLCGALLVLIVSWFHAPNLFIAVIPLAVILFYAGTVVSLVILSSRLHKENKDTKLHEFAEASVSTGVSVTFSMGIALLATAALIRLPSLQNGFVSATEQLLCHGLLLLINALLLCLLLHQIFFPVKQPGERGGTSQATLEVQEKTKSPPTMR